MKRIAWLLAAALTPVGPALAQEDTPAKQPEKQPASADIGATTPGVTVWVWDIQDRLYRLPQVVQGQTPNAYHVMPQVKLAGSFDSPFGPIKEKFVGEAHGWLVIDEPGKYQFKLEGMNGAVLTIDGKKVAELDTSSQYTLPATVDLKKGLHTIKVPFYDDIDDFRVILWWQPPGKNEFLIVPPGAFKTEAGQTYVTSPGPKKWYYADKPLAPGDGCPLTGVHPSMTLENFRGPEFKPQVGGITFLPDGRMALCTWDKVGAVYIVDNLDEREPGGLRVKKFAEGLGEPLAIAVVDGDILVTQKREVTRLRDTDGDGVADVYEMVAGGWPMSHNYHEFTFNLQPHEGALYVTTSVPLKSGDTNYTPGSVQGYATPDGPGSCLKIDPRTGAWEIFARGLRAPNGMGIGPDGILMCCDNQGDWHPSSRLNVIRKGGFYGHQYSPDGKEPMDPPLVWFPQGEIGNSPTQPVLVPDGPYKRQIFVGDVTYGGIQRVYAENVKGVWQGAVFRFCSGLEAGVNRLAWGPDGCLYVGGIGSSGNWNWKNTKFGLQRLRPGKPGGLPFEMKTIESRADGMLVTFTNPADQSLASRAESYEVESWRYEPTVLYGGPKVQQHQLRVNSVTLSPDTTATFLNLGGLQEGTVVHIRLAGMKSAAGESPWTTEGWYTLNKINETSGPGFAPGPTRAIPYPERPAGALVVFDEKIGTANLKQADGKPTRWRVEHGELVVDAAAGNLLTAEALGDCFVHAEWLSPAGGDAAKELNGNSGIKLQERYEIQVLNSPGGGASHALGNGEAGSIYNFKAPDVNASSGAGTWQTYDIEFAAPRWENGKKTADARVSLWWNGVLVHDNVAISKQTGVSAAEAPGDHPLLLQAHPSMADGPVRFRNVWVVRK